MSFATGGLEPLNGKKAWLTGLVVLAVMAVMAAFFYLERIIMPDTAFQVFEIIMRKSFAIQVNRFGAAATQVFPLMAVKAGLSLHQVLLWYSLSFVVFPLVLFAILAWGAKGRVMALALALFALLLTNHTFYWVQSELLQGCVLLIFVFGLATAREQLPWLWLAFLAPLMGVVVFFHPLTFIPYVFLSLFFLGHKVYNRQGAFWAFCLSGLVFLAIKHLVIPTGQYDAGAFQQSAGLWDKIPGFFSWRSTRLFGGYLFTDFYAFVLLFGALMAFYIRNRIFWKAGLIFMFSLGYIVLINGTFDWGGVRFHTESFYQVLGLFVLIPFLYDLAPRWQNKRWFWPALWALLLIRLVHIYAIHPEYSKRIDWYQTLLRHTWKYPETKFAADQQHVPMGTLQLSWGSSFETLVLSALQSPDSTRTVIIYDPNVPMEQFLPQKKAFFQPFAAMPYEWFGESPYFHFRDTALYRVLRQEEIPQ